MSAEPPAAAFGRSGPWPAAAVRHPAGRGSSTGAGWAGRREALFVALALVLAAAPLLWPAMPPLIDLPNHLSRYRIGLGIAGSPYLGRWFLFHWVPVGNLGVDLLVTGLAPLVGLEPATKLVVLLIPVLTVGGLALVAHAAHGRVPATAALAFLFAYNWPFDYGFVNYALAAALALNAFGGWILLAARPRLRAALFVPVGLAVWLAHACGWGMLGLLVFGWELGTRRGAGTGWAHAATGAALACLPLVPPLLPMLHWYGGSALNGEMQAPFDPARKVALLFFSLRHASIIADVGTVAATWGALALAIGRRDVRFDPRLLAAATVLLAAYLAMPAELMGSFHADMRMTPFVLALFALALRPIARTRFTAVLGGLAIALLVGRTLYLGVTYARLDRAWRGELLAVGHVPAGSRVLGLAAVDCPATWAGDRMDHLNRFALTRRDAFTNGTWPPPGQQTVLVRPELPAARDRSDMGLMLPPACRSSPRQALPWALAHLPRARWDYLWLIDMAPRLWPTRTWLQPIWHGERGILYRVLPPGTRRPPAMPARGGR